MEGQFYYIRSALDSYSDGNMAGMGTRIASITPNMMLAYEANRDLIGNKLEIRQDFGDAYLQQGRSMLKIYHTEGKITVVARCYWVKNVLDADQGGRSGPYAHGFLYSDRDREALWRNVDGIFQNGVFERYDSAADRIRRSGALPIQKERTLLHGGPKADMSAFRRAGFDRETFICYMGCLMDALAEQRDNVLVRLPDAARQQWMNGGEDLAESVMHATLCLLPLFIRRRFSGLTHLDTRIDERWLVDTRLFFIDTPSAEEFRELAVGNRRCIDLNNQSCMNIPGDISKGFAAFLWDNLDNEERRNLFEEKLTQLLGVGSGGMSSRSMGDALDLLALQEEEFRGIGAYQKLIFRVIPTLMKADESMFQRIYGAMNEQQVLLEDDLMKRTLQLLMQVGAKVSYMPHILDLCWRHFLCTSSTLSMSVLNHMIEKLHVSVQQLDGMLSRTPAELRDTVPPISAAEMLAKLYAEQKVGTEAEYLVADWAKHLQLHQVKHIGVILAICQSAMGRPRCSEKTAQTGIKLLMQILLSGEAVDASLQQAAEKVLHNQLMKIQKLSQNCQMALSELVLRRWEGTHDRKCFGDLLTLFFNGPEDIVQLCQEILESIVLSEGGGTYFEDFIRAYSALPDHGSRKGVRETVYRLLWIPLERKMPYLENEAFCRLILGMESNIWKPWIVKWMAQHTDRSELYQTLGGKEKELYLCLFTAESRGLIGEVNCLMFASEMEKHYGGNMVSAWLVQVMEEASDQTAFDIVRYRYEEARRGELNHQDVMGLLKLLPEEERKCSRNSRIAKVQKEVLIRLLAENVRRASLESVKNLDSNVCLQLFNAVPKEFQAMELAPWQLIRGKIGLEELKGKNDKNLITCIIGLNDWLKRGVDYKVREYIQNTAKEMLEDRLKNEGVRPDLAAASILLDMDDDKGKRRDKESRLNRLIGIFSVLLAYEDYPEVKNWMLENGQSQDTIRHHQKKISKIVNEMILHNEKSDFQDENLVRLMGEYAKKYVYNEHRKELYWTLKKQGCHVEALFRETDVPKRKYRPLIPVAGVAAWLILSALLFLLASQLERVNGVAAIIVMTVLLLVEGGLCALLVWKLLLTANGKDVYVQRRPPRRANSQKTGNAVQNEEEFEELSERDTGKDWMPEEGNDEWQ